MALPNSIKYILPLLLLLAVPTFVAMASEPEPTAANVRIVATDPPTDSYLAAGERLYLRIRYESTVPVRFEVEALRQGNVLRSAGRNAAPPYDAGRGDALAWLVMSTPVRIDELRVAAFDLEWKELGHATATAVITWEQADHHEPREPAEWVGPLLKQHRRVFDTAYDPLPERPQPFFDLFLLISFVSIPLYLLMQTQMLIRYRGRWQWYAAAPLLPVIPLVLYSLIGLGPSKALWVKFLFHYMTAALLYLLILWTVKRDREKELRAARKQHPVDSSAGTE